MFGLMTPYPGTEVARLAANNEGGYRLQTKDWDNFSKQMGGALEFADLNKRQIEWLQIKAYASVFLLNGRFIDFFKLLWEFRVGAIKVLKKFIAGSKNLHQDSNKPKDYDSYFNNSNALPLTGFIQSRENWVKQQKSEIQRTRKEMPSLFKLGE